MSTSRKIPKKEINTPVNTKELGKALTKHPNRCLVSYLILGFMHGFLAGLSYLPTFSFTCQNLQSAVKDPQAADELLGKEIEKVS